MYLCIYKIYIHMTGCRRIELETSNHLLLCAAVCLQKVCLSSDDRSPHALPSSSINTYTHTSSNFKTDTDRDHILTCICISLSWCHLFFVHYMHMCIKSLLLLMFFLWFLPSFLLFSFFLCVFLVFCSSNLLHFRKNGINLVCIASPWLYIISFPGGI